MKDKRWEVRWEGGRKRHKGTQLDKKDRPECQKRGHRKHKTKKWREERKYWKKEEKERG